VVRLSSIRGGKRGLLAFRRSTTGATLAEYAIMLFLITVVAAVGVRLLGVGVARKFGAADKGLQGQAPTASSAQAAGSASAAANASKATVDINKDPTAAGGGGNSDKGNSEQGGLPFLVKFALIALGVIGAAAAFLAMWKGRPQGG
jgi:Flp pilus assembly pilin Flp